MAAEVTVVPANEASWADIQEVFGTRGTASYCWCQRYKLRPREAFSKFPAEERAMRMHAQTNCGDPARRCRRGLVASRRRAGRLVRGRAADGVRGAAAQQPRAVGGPGRGQVRQRRLGGDVRPRPRGTPATGDQPRARRPPWTSPVTAAPARSRGIRGSPSRARTSPGTRSTSAPGAFSAAAGFTQVSHPTLRRVVMRIDF